MPSLSGRNESSPVLLGGVIAALILRLALAPYSYDFLSWFALVPLFYSLYRNRHRPWRRLFHGMSFSLLLVLWCNSWFFTALSPVPTDEGSVLGYLRAAASSSLAWIVIALFTGIFSVASGRLFRSERTLVAVIGIPFLWVGLEVLRGPLAPIRSPWVSGWLSLGYALHPARPEAQIASIVGVYGASFLIVLCSTLLLACLLTPRFKTQMTYAILAATVPLSAYGYGRLTTPRLAPVGDTPVAMISQVDNTTEAILEFAMSMAATNPEIILWSDVALSHAATGGSGDPTDNLQDFLTRLSSVWEPDADGTGESPSKEEARSIGSVLLTNGGRLVAVYRSPPPGTGAPPPPGNGEVRIYYTSRGSFVLGIDFDFLIPTLARVASAGEAQLLVSSARTREDWGERAHLQQLNMASFRAVENRRWLVTASSTGAYVIDPYGRPALELRRGFDSAGVESVSFLSTKSIYTTCGWWAEPFSGLLAVGLVIYSVVPRLRGGAGRRKRREAGGITADG